MVVEEIILKSLIAEISFKTKFSKYKITEVQYKTTEMGEFIEILNWKEIASMMNNLFDDIINIIGGNDSKRKKALKNLMLPLKKIYSTKQGVEKLVLKELQYFHFPLGLEFELTEPIIYENEIPNMFGGKPLKGMSKIHFENVDFDDGFCVLKQEMTINQEDSKRLLKQVFKKMKLDDGKREKAIMDGIYIIKDNNTFEYYFDPGIPHKIETIRETIIETGNEKGRRVDKIIIELIYQD